MASRRRLEERLAFASHAIRHRRFRRCPALEALEGRALLSTFTVNSLGDAGTGSNDSGDLRYCINQANANDQANSIVFDSTVFGTPQTVKLNGSQLELRDTGGTQTITGPAAAVTISGGGKSRVFQVDSGVAASISGLTISGGSTSSGNGGGLDNNGTVTLTNCTVSGNTAGFGGGVYNSGTAKLIGCTLTGNIAYYPEFGSYGVYNISTGGGVNNASSANLTMTGCTVSANSAGDGGGGVSNSGTTNLTGCTVTANSGGGVSNYGSAALTGCTISGNSGAGGLHNQGTANLTDCIVSGNNGFAGGGLNNQGTANLTDCTVSGNSASFGGGGVFNGGTATITACTLSDNSASDGGGLNNGGTAYLTDCTLSGNSAATYGGGVWAVTARRTSPTARSAATPPASAAAALKTPVCSPTAAGTSTAGST